MAKKGVLSMRELSQCSPGNLPRKIVYVFSNIANPFSNVENMKPCCLPNSLTQIILQYISESKTTSPGKSLNKLKEYQCSRCYNIYFLY